MQLIVRDDEEIANAIPVSEVVPENMDVEENCNEVLVVETATEAMDSAEDANAGNANQVPVAEMDSEYSDDTGIAKKMEDEKNDKENLVVEAALESMDSAENANVENANEVPVVNDVDVANDTGLANDVDVVDMVDEYMAYPENGVLDHDDTGPADDVGHEIHLHEDNVIEVGESATLNDDVVGVEDNKDSCQVNSEPSEPPEKDLTLPTLDTDHINSEVASIKSNVGDIEKRVGDVDVSYLLRELAILKQRIGVVENVLGVKFEEKLQANDAKCLVNDSKMKVRRFLFFLILY